MGADLWAAEQLEGGDVEALADYRRRAPGMTCLHPTVEHFVPLVVTLGAATDHEARGSRPSTGFWIALSKRSLHVA